jgi:SAM-dependent methyltransferase
MNNPNVKNSGWYDYIPEPKHFKTETPFAGDALYKFINDYSFTNLLEIGPGPGIQNRILKEHTSSSITTIDISNKLFDADILSDYTLYKFEDQFDAIWCSHVLEHIIEPQTFLKKLYADLKEGGLLAITVPPLKHDIVQGHVTLWNAGLLLIHLIRAGFDCTDARVGTYGYNVSVIIRKKSIIDPEKSERSDQPYRLYDYLPNSIILGPNNEFDGRIININW